MADYLAHLAAFVGLGGVLSPLGGWTVAEVMQTGAACLRDSDSLTAASDSLMRQRAHGLPVTNADGELVGILTVQDIERAQLDHDHRPKVGDICTRSLLTTHPDESLGAALRRMSARDVGRLPVVARGDPRRLLGVLRRVDAIRAYDVALTRRAALRHSAETATEELTR